MGEVTPAVKLAVIDQKSFVKEKESLSWMRDLVWKREWQHEICRETDTLGSKSELFFLLAMWLAGSLYSLRWDVFICKRELVLIFTPMGLLELNRIDTIGKHTEVLNTY